VIMLVLVVKHTQSIRTVDFRLRKHEQRTCIALRWDLGADATENSVLGH